MAGSMLEFVRELKTLNKRKKDGEELSEAELQRRKELKLYLKGELEKREGGSRRRGCTGTCTGTGTCTCTSTCTSGRCSTAGTRADATSECASGRAAEKSVREQVRYRCRRFDE